VPAGVPGETLTGPQSRGEVVAQAQVAVLKALLDRQRDGVLRLYNGDSGRVERYRVPFRRSRLLTLSLSN
jgi:hypothetical protein